MVQSPRGWTRGEVIDDAVKLRLLAEHRRKVVSTKPLNSSKLVMVQDIIETLRLVMDDRFNETPVVPVPDAGMKSRNCLGCGRSFLSAGPGNRLCLNCIAKD